MDTPDLLFIDLTLILCVTQFNLLSVSLTLRYLICDWLLKWHSPIFALELDSRSWLVKRQISNQNEWVQSMLSLFEPHGMVAALIGLSLMLSVVIAAPLDTKQYNSSVPHITTETASGIVVSCYKLLSY